jgi:hypothetical protein
MCSEDLVPLAEEGLAHIHEETLKAIFCPLIPLASRAVTHRWLHGSM